MPLNIKAFERAMKRAAEEKKKAALSAPTPAPVAAKAPVVAPKQEEQPELKSNLTQEEIDAYVRLAFPDYKKQPSMTDIIIKRKLAEMGLEPVKH
ncbi:hypothetical protein [Stutzerimonas stutzeri]|uniref:hypothetical protein n=1 Tax=Stutzerimonas stutzeri TaxID=316 RepID=UPI000F766653|nr:hypothetical protein [Stutzerimonas stutzeri]RSH69355.1 hypothetical protein EGV02_02800 [Stutzerimonas stutzeri]